MAAQPAASPGYSYPPSSYAPLEGTNHQQPAGYPPPPHQVNQGYPQQPAGYGYPPPPHPADQGYPQQPTGYNYPPPPHAVNQGYPQQPGGYSPPPHPVNQGYPPQENQQADQKPLNPKLPPPTPTYSESADPITVIGPQYCAPYQVDLTIQKKLLKLGEGHFSVHDINGNSLLTVKGAIISLRDKRVLVDSEGNPLVNMRQKIITAHRRWDVYRGEDTAEPLFSVKKSSLIQLKTNLEVFLQSNTSEKTCDFRIKGSWQERSCVVTHGESKVIVAKMHKDHNIKSHVLGADTFSLTIYPNVDYAFIVALIVVLYEVNQDRKGAGGKLSLSDPLSVISGDD